MTNLLNLVHSSSLSDEVSLCCLQPYHDPFSRPHQVFGLWPFSMITTLIYPSLPLTLVRGCLLATRTLKKDIIFILWIITNNSFPLVLHCFSPLATSPTSSSLLDPSLPLLVHSLLVHSLLHRFSIVSII